MARRQAVLRRLVLAAGVVTALATPAAAPGSPRPACAPAGARIVASTNVLVAYTLRVPLRSAGVGLDLWACTSRRRIQVTAANALGSFGAADHQGPGPLAVAGERLAVGVGSDDGAGLMYSVKVVTFSSAGVRLSGDGDTVGPIAGLSLSSSGDVAWSGCIPGTAAPGSPEYEAAESNPLAPFACRHTDESTGYVAAHGRAEQPGHSHLYALACAVDPNYVTLTRGRVEWRQAGARRSLPLKSPPPSASLPSGVPGAIGCTGRP
jgi:hypothetical protein